MRTVREVMTARPIRVQADDTLAVVARLMAEGDTGFIPVMEGDLPVGVLTDRDLVVRAIARGLDPAATAASEICSYRILSVGPDETIDTAIKRMEHRQVRRLLVLEDRQLVGVVSLGDLAECLPDQAEQVLVEVSRSPKTLAHRSVLGLDLTSDLTPDLTPDVAIDEGPSTGRGRPFPGDRDRL